MGGKTYNTVLGILQIELQRLNGRLLFSSFLFLAVGGSSFFLCRLVGLVVDSLLLLRHHETVVSINVEEHDEVIGLIAVSTMVLVTTTVALEQHGLATEHPVWVEVGISAVGEVVRLLLA